MTELTDKVRSRGHWDVAIRPATFVADRVPYEQLDEVIPSVEVRMRGWPVPYVDYGRDAVLHGNDWVGQDVDADVVDHYEAWRFFTSGQFAHLRSVSADWRSGREAVRVREDFKSLIEVWEILFYLTEVFELASRLALSPAGDEQMVVSASLQPLEDRGLIVGQQNRAEFIVPMRSHVDSFSHEVELPRDKLISEGRIAAAEMAREFFLRFGWKPPLDQLLDHQRELTERN
ncbi:MAG TPA: hypothetical protein VGG40_11675 [Solirubrobacterales bacterium]|jgi:hypothetical protein